MGIGWTPAYRAEVLGPALLGNAASKTAATAFVADGPAVCRRLTTTFPGPGGAARSARKIAQCLAKQLLSHTADGTLSGKVVSVFFDKLGQMPAQRAIVAASRARGAPPLTPAETASIDALNLADGVTPGHLTTPLPWDLLLRERRTKRIVWELLGRAVFAVFCEIDGCSVEVVTEGNQWARGYDGALPPMAVSGHGEADLLVRERSTELVEAKGHVVEIVTVDYDQVLQSLLEATAGARYLRYPKELLDMHSLRGQFGDSRDTLLTAAFFLLAAFRSDYSKSLCRPAKMKVMDFVRLMKDGDAKVVVEDVTAGGGRCLVFFPEVARTLLKQVNDNVRTMVGPILWTIAYFAGYESSKRQPELAYDVDVWTRARVVFASDDGAF